MSETKTRKAAGTGKAGGKQLPARSRRSTQAGSGAAALLEKLGLGWVLDLVASGAAAGIVLGRYGADATQAQLRLYADAARAIVDAERRVTSSLMKGEVLDLLRWLADAIADRVAAINSVLGMATAADFEEIGRRLGAIDRRITAIERARRRSARAPEAEASAMEPAKADPPSPIVRVDTRPIVDTSSTMFIGSVPAGGPIEPRPERASSVSSKPDAMSAYLAKNPAAEEDGGATQRRGRRRGADN